MSLFQRFPYAEDASFTPLFRLLDDFDTYSRAGGRTGAASGSRTAPSFSPKFDVRETENTYELHGELPGIDRKDVSIEFTEPQTIVVRGRVERNYTSGTPPAGLVEGAPQASGALPASESAHHASVSDEETEAAKEKGVVSAKKEKEQKQQPAERYWHQERSIGEFQRAFSFPTRVNEAGVSASLKDGILHVSVPKAIKHEKRSIAIN